MPLPQREDLSTAPVQMNPGEGSIEITKDDIAALDKDTPAAEHTPGRKGSSNAAVESAHDEMGAAAEVFDRSEFIEYYYFKCTDPKCTGGLNKTPRKVFAGSYDAGPVADAAGTAKAEVECTCVPDKTKKKPYKGRNGEELFVHGVMKLHHYKSPRPERS